MSLKQTISLQIAIAEYPCVQAQRSDPRNRHIRLTVHVELSYSNILYYLLHCSGHVHEKIIIQFNSILGGVPKMLRSRILGVNIAIAYYLSLLVVTCRYLSS